MQYQDSSYSKEARELKFALLLIKSTFANPDAFTENEIDTLSRNRLAYLMYSFKSLWVPVVSVAWQVFGSVGQWQALLPELSLPIRDRC